jgi:hypothetical protein
MNTPSMLKKRIRVHLITFLVLLCLSGITAFPIETELSWLIRHLSWVPPLFHDWIQQVHRAVTLTNAQYPYLAYGTDWLAFAHFVIAIVFIGPLKDPVRNIWVVEFGMIACVLIFPVATIAGSIREIPFFWQLVDCSFGFGGVLLLYSCYRDILLLEARQKELQ